MKYELRPYQIAAVEGVREKFRGGSKACMIVAPTGSGKTVIACHIVEQSQLKGSRTLFLAHRKELIEQCSAKLDEIGLWHGIIKAGNPRNEPSALVQVASVATLVRRLDKIEQDFRLIIIDEVHHLTVDGTYSRILKANPNARIIGLTATPYRHDGKGLGDLLDSYVEVATIEGLIRDGFLVPQRVFVGQKVKLDGIKTVAGDYNLGQLAEAVNKPKITGNIVSAWQKYASDRLTVCFTVNIAHSKAIVDAFRAAGVMIEHLDGTTPEDERTAILKRFEKGETRIISNCAVLTEGWDAPRCSALILARPTKSRGLWRQMCGRTLRPFPGKTDCVILDHGNTTDLHGFLTDPDRISLDKTSISKVAPTRRCKECGSEFAGRPKFCPSCGADLEPEGERIDEVLTLGDSQYELVEVTKQAKPVRSDQTLEFLYFADLEKAYRNGYKPGYADIRHRQRTGRWPSNELRNKAPIRTEFKQTEMGWTKTWGTAKEASGFK